MYGPFVLMYILMYYFAFVYMHAADTCSCMIENAAMKDERGDDVPDNESNEWEVGRELMCSSQSRNVFAISQELTYYQIFTYVHCI